jgi:hypothetical protein
MRPIALCWDHLRCTGVTVEPAFKNQPEDPKTVCKQRDGCARYLQLHSRGLTTGVTIAVKNCEIFMPQEYTDKSPFADE